VLQVSIPGSPFQRPNEKRPRLFTAPTQISLLSLTPYICKEAIVVPSMFVAMVCSGPKPPPDVQTR